MTDQHSAPSLLQQVRAHAKARDSIAWSGQARQLLLWAADTIEAANAALRSETAPLKYPSSDDVGVYVMSNGDRWAIAGPVARDIALKNAAPQVALSSESTATNAQETGQSGTPAESGSEPPNTTDEVWEVFNRASSILLATEADADRYMTSFSPAVGMTKTRRHVLRLDERPD